MGATEFCLTHTWMYYQVLHVQQTPYSHSYRFPLTVSTQHSDTNRPREVAAYCRVPQRPLPSLWVLKCGARKFAMQK